MTLEQTRQAKKILMEEIKKEFPDANCWMDENLDDDEAKYERAMLSAMERFSEFEGIKTSLGKSIYQHLKDQNDTLDEKINELEKDVEYWKERAENLYDLL